VGGVAATDRYAIGGSRVLRGYVENSVMGDSVIASSLEYLLPLRVTAKFIGVQKVYAIPFIDYARVWQKDRATQNHTSIGWSLRWRYQQSLTTQLTWGYGFNQAQTRGANIQNYGVQFNIDYRL
jgi:hemolysin activation/secretion protein